MNKKNCLTFLICFSFWVLYAQQDCVVLLQSAQQLKAEGKYESACDRYEKLNEKCPGYVNEAVRRDWNYCKIKKGGQNKPNPQKSSIGYVSVHQHITGSISNVEPYFDASGNCLNETNIIRVSINDWSFLVDESCQDWLKVERSGNSLIVTCRDNPDKEKRVGEIFVIGEINEQIVVTQYGATSSKSSAQTNYKAQTTSPAETKEEQPIIVKITFENGKAKPKFDNNVGRLITSMVENNNLGLQIEVNKCETQSGIKKLIKASLIDKRFKEIIEHFVNLGIDNNRISKNIIVIDGDKNGVECDCAYAKTKKKE